MNNTTIQLMQENVVQKWTKEQWEVESKILIENIKKAYQATQDQTEQKTEEVNPPQNEAKSPVLGVEVEPVEEKTPKIYMSKDEL